MTKRAYDGRCPHKERIQYRVTIIKHLLFPLPGKEFLMCQGCISDVLEKAYKLTGRDLFEEFVGGTEHG